MIRFFRLLFQKLRLSNPWRYKAPFLISIPYFFLLSGGFATEEAYISIGFSLMTILGIAGFGYWANDYSDREEDRAAGKPNALIDMPKIQAFGILLFLLIAAILPWVIYFPVTQWTGILLATEFLLFILYSAPPFRFKERGILGPIADALYAHVNPALLAAVTFNELAIFPTANLEYWLIALCLFQFGLGMRNILLHQLKDYENDLTSGAKTWVVKIGKESGRKILRNVFLPLEIVALIAFMWFTNQTFGYFLFGFPVFFLMAVFRIRVLWKKELPTDLRGILNHFFDDFYTEWIPVLMLVGLMLEDVNTAGLLVIHFFLFRNCLKSFLRDFYNRFLKGALRR